MVGKQSLGILLEGDKDKILLIIRKGWNDLYQWVKKQNKVSVGDTFFMLSNGKVNVDNIPDDVFQAWQMVAILTGMLLDKEIDEQDASYQSFMNGLFLQLQFLVAGCYIDNEQMKQNSAKIKNLKNNVYEHANIGSNFLSFKNSKEDYVVNSYEFISCLFDSECLSTDIFENEVMSERDAEHIIGAYFLSFNNLDRKEAAKLFISGFVIKALLKAYKHAKEQYFKTSRENLFLDLDIAEHNAQVAQDEVKTLRQLLIQRDKEILGLQKEIKSEYSRAVTQYQGQLKSIHAENEDLRQHLSRVKDEIEELSQALFYEQYEQEKDFDSVELSYYQAVIVGGREDWQGRLKAVIPHNWRFICKDKRYDLSIISSADIVFINTANLSHAIFYDIIGEARRRGIPVAYIKSSNEKECMKEIHSALIKNQAA